MTLFCVETRLQRCPAPGPGPSLGLSAAPQPLTRPESEA